MGLGTWELTQDIGEAIRRSGVARDSFYLVTKVEETDDAYESTRRNLTELQLGFADLILIHRPPPNGAGEALWRGLMRARKDGLVRDIGVSNYSVDLIETLAEATGEMPAVNQIEWSPFGHSDRVLHYAKGKGIVIQAYSPLTRARRLDDDRRGEIARKYEKSPAQLLIRWNLQRGTVPLPKANQRRHLRENIEVFDFEIAADDVEVMTSMNEEYSSLGTLPYT